jgi:hypothetical protein
MDRLYPWLRVSCSNNNTRRMGDAPNNCRHCAQFENFIFIDLLAPSEDITRP